MVPYRTKTKEWCLVCCATLLHFGTAIGDTPKTVDLSLFRGHDRFYVSPQGNDDWSGTLAEPNAEKKDGPLASLTAARNAIRKWKSDGRYVHPITVLVLDGTYRLAEPVKFTSEDSGTEKEPIVYRAFPGHHPIVSGGQLISGWTAHRDDIVKAKLPPAAKTGHALRQLIFNGQSQPRSGWPNRDPQNPLYSGWAFVDAALPTQSGESVTFRFAADTASQEWSKPHRAEVSVFHWYCWINDLVPLQRIDKNQQSIALARNVSQSWMPLVAGNRFRVENVLEELDQPGEWYVDSDANSLYFWPPEPINDHSRVEVPICDTLVEVRGTAEASVKHLTFFGLTFAVTRTTFPEHLNPNFHSPLLRGGAIVFEHCQKCRILENEFCNLGSDAIRLEKVNADNEIIGNCISHVGGAGISFSSPDEAGNTDVWSDQTALRQISARFPTLRRNLVANNYIQHCGEIKKGGAAIQFYGINSVDNLIRHNLIHHTPDKAMNMQDGFGRFIVEYNEIHDVGLEIADTGGIVTNRWFTLKDDQELAAGNVIRFNLIRDVVGCAAYSEKRPPQGEGDRLLPGGRIRSPYYTWGIYFDNSAEEVTVFGNIVVRAVLGGATMSVGRTRNNRIDNNVFVDCSGQQLDLRMEAGSIGNRFARNILCYSSPDAMLLATNDHAPSTISECDHNLYWHSGGQPLKVRGMAGGALDDWKKLGFDSHSVVADPLFVDPAAGDYRLRPDSPALALGFKPIDTEKIGLREPYRSRLANRAE